MNDNIITKYNFISYLNNENNYECHNIIFNLLKIYNIQYSKNSNGIFINYDNLNSDIIDIIINYINDYIKKKNINKNILYNQMKNKEFNNIDTHFYIPLNKEQLNKFNSFQELCLTYNHKKNIRPSIIKKKYNCKVNNSYTFENVFNINTIKTENYLL